MCFSYIAIFFVCGVSYIPHPVVQSLPLRMCVVSELKNKNETENRLQLNMKCLFALTHNAFYAQNILYQINIHWKKEKQMRSLYMISLCVYIYLCDVSQVVNKHVWMHSACKQPFRFLKMRRAKGKKKNHNTYNVNEIQYDHLFFFFVEMSIISKSAFMLVYAPVIRSNFQWILPSFSGMP